MSNHKPLFSVVVSFIVISFITIAAFPSDVTAQRLAGNDNSLRVLPIDSAGMENKKAARPVETYSSDVADMSVVAWASSSRVLTPGTCGEFGGLAIEVEGTGGTNASYSTLKAAFDAINAGTHTGVITIDVCGNTDETTNSAVLNASGTGSASYTSIVIAPAGGAARTITGATTAGSPLIDLNGASNVTIDGLNTGGNSLTISNTTVSATASTSTIRFINGASNDFVKNSSILGSSTSSNTTAGGNILFSTTTGAGNNNNTISGNNLGPAGSNLPTKAILGLGTSTAVNANEIIDNNNLFDYFGTGAASVAGISVSSNCNNWIISNNRIFQTATRTFTTTALRYTGIVINSSGNSFTVTGNVIGFGASNGTGTTTINGSSNEFRGIDIPSVNATTPTSIQGNIISGINQTSSRASTTTSSSAFIGIVVGTSTGRFDIGTVVGNRIGSLDGSSTVVLTETSTTASTAPFVGIYDNSFVTGNSVSNNQMGAITINSGGTGTTVGFRGILLGQTTGVSETANNNIIGGSTVAGAITDNIVGNYGMYGMQVASANLTATGNIFRNFVGNANGAVVTLGGLIASGSTGANFISQNTVHSLTDTVTGGSSGAIYGMSLTLPAATNTVERNLIHSLSVSSTFTAYQLWGISCGATGTATYKNNMIRLGLDSTGASITTGFSIIGLRDSAGTTNNFYNNSVYIGGTGVVSVSNTYGILSSTTNSRDIRDNILFNGRSNASGGIANVSLSVAGSTPNPAGLTSNSNVLYFSGTDGATGVFNALVVGSLAAWQTATGQDVNSFASDPKYLSPNGTATTGDLHIDPSVLTVIEGNGTSVASVTDDFDGQLRSSFTPVDIGADAGNFLGIDLSAPNISYTAFGNTVSTANRVLGSTITDTTGVDSGANLPRIYFKKSTDASYVSTQCVSSGGTPQNGTYNCTVNNALVGGGSVGSGDTIQYFVIAQDTLGNVGSNPAGTTATNVNTVTVAPASPSSYSIVPAISGTKTVGSGGDYPTLTAAIAAVNGGVITGPTTLSLTDASYGSETFPLTINPNSGSSASNTLTIKPATGVTPAITGSSASCLLNINGADWVIIDGSNTVGGTTRDATYTNTNTGTSSAVVCIETNGADGSTNNIVKNNNVVGTSVTATAGTLAGVFSGSSTISNSSTGTGNNNNTIQNNSITKTVYGIYSGGASAAAPNTGTVITKNVMNAATPNNITTGGILVNFDDGAVISQNDIAVLKNDGTTGTSGTAFGIALGSVPTNQTTFTGNNVTNATVTRNKINGIVQLSSTGYSAIGIVVNSVPNGTTLVSNNMVIGVQEASTSPDIGAGIIAGGGAGSTTNVYYNSVSMTGSRNAATFPSYGLAINSGNPTVNVLNNIFYNTQTSTSTGKQYAIGNGSTTFSNMTSNHNDLFVSGASGFVGQTGGLGTTGTDRTLLSDWQTASGQDSTPNGSVSVDPLFTSTSDLHLTGPSPMINAGSTVAGTTIDFDGDPRPAGAAAEIGADELIDTTAPDTQILTNPANPTNSGSAAFTFSGTDSLMAPAVVASFECKLDAGSFAVCISPQNYSSLSDGSHNFQVRAKDTAGNVDPSPASFTWVVDTTAPDTSITANPANPTNSASASFSFIGNDGAGVGGLTFECKLDAASFAACTSPQAYSGLTDGSHTFQVRANDSLGNTDATPATFTWVVDTVAPDTSILTNPSNPSTSASASFTFSGTDATSGVASFECKLDAGSFAACTSPQNYTGLSAGSHTFQVRAIDSAGNADATPASYTWTINLAGVGPVTVVATTGTTGPTDYTTLKAAFDAINAGTHTGTINITVLSDTTETASAVLNGSGTGSASYTSISIKPTGGAARTISGNVAGHLIDLNGANNVTIDGLNTGGNSLTISNTSQQVGASTIRFVNDASNNTVTNSTLAGASGAALSSGFGVIYFATGTTTGNDNNTISNNNITGAGGAQPINGIYSFGTSSAIDNSGEIISGNNISDYFNTNSSSNGINVNSGSSTWTITNNKFFQTATRTYLTAATHNGINVLTGSGYTITGNTIGYATSNATGTYTMTGTVATRFFAINLAVGTTADTSVQGNTVASISTTGIGTNSGCGSLCGLNITSGNVNVGNVTPNTFGSTTGTGSLTATPTTTTAAAVIGVNTGSTGNIVISNNTFGSFTSASATATNPGSVFAVVVTGAATSLTITGNTMGNTTADNMRAGVLGTTTGASIAGGIIASAIPAVYNYSNNTIRNISSYGTSTSGYVRGIQTGTTPSATAVATINNNTITNLTTSGAVTSISSGNAAAQGIQFLPGINSTISGNTISNISDVNTGAIASVVAGITHGSATNTVISKNVIFGLSNASTNTSTTTPGVITGIAIRSGTTAVTVVNNMISLGNAQSTNTAVIGIWGNHGSTPDPTDQIYFNTVNIEGTVSSGAQPSMGFLRGDLTATARTAPVDVRNNIFNNTRSGGTGKHYAIANDYGATTTATGWASGASNYNVLNSNAATVGFWTTDQTFSGWKAASTSDSLSYSGTPVTFVSSANNLHLNMGVTPTSLESGGVPIAGYATDIDGQVRPGPAGSVNGGGFAPDLGADEFDGVYLDAVAPIITYTALSNLTSTANRTLSVNITDGTGVASGGNAPRVYFKKSTDAGYVSNGCSFASGTAQNGNYNCVINYALVGGGAVATGDSVQYFVVAQDTIGNLASNPAVGFSGTNVNTVTTPPTTPNSYIISIPYSGNYSVGTGGAYASLTNPGGIFEALNAGVITGNITVNIISDLTVETGAVSLNQTTEEGAGNYTITIKPSGAARVISGSSTTWLIRLADADRVTIDGSLSGGTAAGVGGDPSLRNLTIQNTSTTATAGAVVVMSAVSNGAQNNTVKNTIISGQDATQTLIGLAIGGATVGSAGGPNNNDRVENCSFQKAIIGIYDAGASSAAQNTGHVITMNDLSSTGTSKLRRAGMLFFNHDNLQVTLNSVGGIADDEGIDVYGIGVGIQSYSSTVVASGAITNSLVSRNKVNGVASTSTTGFTAAGIGIAGGTTGANVVSNNMVTGVNAPSTSPDLVAGIFVAGAPGSSTKLYFNSVSMTGDRTAVASQIGSYALAVTGTDPTLELKDNIFYTTQTSGGGANAKSYAIGMQTTTFVNLDSNYNDFVSTGANAGGFRTGGIDTSATDLATLSAWQTATAKDGSSFAVDPTFVDPLTNLHLQAGSPMLNVGIAAGGITVDIDGDTRPSGAGYEIGADEIDQTAPDTQILTNPTDPSNSSSATFTFTGTDAFASVVASFECKLDAGAFAACTSPANYTGLSQGSHNFQVRAIDGAGNVDPTPASYTWSVDAIAPDTQILTNPTDPSNSSNATFTFSGTDSYANVVASFECKLDGGSFAACTSPKNYTGLADGPHTFQVRAIDAVGNVDPTPASYTWNIVTTFTGPVTVTASAGTAGPTDYPTLQAAFDAINLGTHQGAVIVNVVTNTTETAPAVLNSSGAGSALYASVLVRPYNDGVTVSGATATGRGLVELNGADNVTIDGDNPNTAGINRNLTFQNTAANTVTFTSVIRLAVATTVVTSADNVTIKNLNLFGSATGRNLAANTSTTGSENTTFGIFAGPGASTVSATTAPSAVASVSTSVAAGATMANLVVSNNVITTAARGVTANGSATTVFPGLQISGNRIGNQTAGALDQVYSVGITAQGSANGIISGNTVWVEGFVASSAATHGIDVGVNSATGTFTIDSNAVNRARNLNGGTWAAYGINLGGGNNHVVQNNFVSGVINDQTAGTGAFSTTFGAAGIRVGSGTGHKVYHNSVNLYGALGGIVSTDLTAALMVVATSQTGVDIRNNIFSNQITGGNPTGTRNVSVFMPSGATVTMNLTDNNNGYFTGTDPQNRLAQVGTTFGTGEYLAVNFDPSSTSPATNLRAYTSTLSVAGTNDGSSFVKQTAPPFTSNSDLHIPNATVTQLESGGAAVGVAVDIDGQTRPNGTAPDIGADEFTGVLPPSNDIQATSFVVPANGSLIPTGGAVTPQASFSNVGLGVQTSINVQFTMNGPGGFTYTDTKSIATINPGQTVTVTFAATPTLTLAGAYTMGAAVTTPDANSSNDAISGGFNAANPASGTISIGSGGDFTSLTNPGGLFERLNQLGATGAVTANITSDLTAETGVVALNELPAGASLLIKPSGAPRTISGNAASLSMIKLNGADNITIDGSLNGGSDRSLQLLYTNTGGTVIWIAAQSAANGANNNTVKNCVIASNPGTLSVAGILAGSGATLGNAAEAPNSNNTIQNNWIYRVQNSMFISGAATFDQNWNITGNTLGSTVAADKNVFRGMLIGGAQNFVVNGNTVSGISSTATTAAAMSGIQIALTVNGGFVVNNKISDIKNNSASGTGAFGMQISTTSAAANVTIANNFVSDIATLGSATIVNNGHGINVNGAATGGYKIYNNSINMNTNQASGVTSALNVTSAVTAAGALDIRNNILANTQTSGATRYAVYNAAATNVLGPIDYNDYFAQNVGFTGGTAQATLANWQTATGLDVNSKAVDPTFVTSSDLHLLAGSPMIDTGVTIAAVNSDIDGQTRPIGATYDIGADEWVATATISGFVTTPSGKGIRNVLVTISGGSLAQPITIQTGDLGSYSFPNLPTTQTYTVTVVGKRYTFANPAQVITLYTNLSATNFISNEDLK